MGVPLISRRYSTFWYSAFVLGPNCHLIPRTHQTPNGVHTLMNSSLIVCVWATCMAPGHTCRLSIQASETLHNKNL